MSAPPPQSATGPPRYREWPIALVLSVVAVGLVVVAVGSFRRGCIVLAGGVVLAFFLRAMLPTPAAGMLAVRSRSVDLVVLAVLGVSVSVLAFWVPVGG